MLSNISILKKAFWGMAMLLFASITLPGQDLAYRSNEVQLFEAKYLPERGVQLSWATKYNDTTAYFVIERSLDGLHFEAVEELKATNTRSNFKIIDRQPYKDVSYYRLQVIDYDGNVFVSNVISVFIPNQGKPELVLYPMPVGNDETLSMHFQGIEQNCKIYVQVTDHTGRKVLSREAEINSFHRSSELSFDGKLSPGNYQVIVVGHSGASFKIGKLLQIVP